MTKVIGMLVALAMFCAMPAVAFGGGDISNEDQGVGGSVDVEAGGGGSGGDGDGGDADGDGEGDGGDGEGGEGGDGGDGGDACGISQGAGEDANAECNFDGSGDTTNEGNTFVDGDGDGVDDNDESDSDGVEGVELARTGFDVGVLALFGGIALASGLALLIVQRRRIS